MRLHDIALASIHRRKTRFVFVLGVIGLGVATIVALTALTRTMQREVGDELDRFGANILITPRSDAISHAFAAVRSKRPATDFSPLLTVQRAVFAAPMPLPRKLGPSALKFVPGSIQASVR